MIYPNNFENKIGFNQIRDLLKGYCLFLPGQQCVDNIRFSDNVEHITRELDLSMEMKDIVENHHQFPSQNFIDTKDFFDKIKLEGSYATVAELFDFKRSLDTIRAILHFFKTTDPEKYPEIKKQAAEVKITPFIFDRIGGILNSKGEVKDNASPELQDIRSTLRSKRNSISKILHTILKKAQSEGLVDSDVSISVRDGKMVIPIDVANKRSIRGYIHDESATGKTAYIEPEEAVEANNQIRELEYAEQREIIKILIECAADLRPYAPELTNAYYFLATIDFIRAKAKLAISLDAIKPSIKDETLIKWYSARHPLLYLAHKKENKEVVPLQIEIYDEQRILLISGPNAGGKSVCLKTVGLLQYMFQCGIPVSATHGSEFGIFKDVFIDIGDEQSLENDLSTYSSHLLNMRNFTKHAGGKSLMLIDEFGTGTEPQLGGAIAEAILNHLNKVGAWGVITTHYANLKHFASSQEGIVNCAMMFDMQRLQPTFQLSIGKPGSSFAFEIARKIGLPETILAEAKEKVGEDHVFFDKHLKDIQRDKNYWENKRYRIRKSEKKLEEIVEKYKTELEKSKEERKEILAQAKKEAKEIVDGANKVIEKTIREIKEAQAEKERTKHARKNVDEYKEVIEKKGQHDTRKIDAKIKKLQEREQRLNANNEEEVKPKVVEPEKKELAVGDKVRMEGQDTVGEVMDVNKNSIMVAFGNMITTVKKEKLTQISNKEYKRLTRHTPSIAHKLDVGQRRNNFKHQIDVRGQRTDDAIMMVSQYIDEAVVVQASEVAILHGKGNGILREMIRNYLGTLPFITSFKDEKIELGGSGITVVRFE